MLTIILREDLTAVSATEVAPGIVFHYAQRPGEPGDEDTLVRDNRDVVVIEIEAARGRSVSDVIYEVIDAAGETVFRTPGKD